MWNNMKYMRDASEMEDDFTEDALDRAYKRGCKHGYEKGYRDGSEDASSSASSSSSYGERRAWRVEEEDSGRRRRTRDDYDNDGYGERYYHRSSDGRFR